MHLSMPWKRLAEIPFRSTPRGVVLLVLALGLAGSDATRAAEPEVPPTPDERYEEFREALREGEKRRVRRMVEEPGFLALETASGRTPVFALDVADSADEEELIDLVLAARPDLEHRDQDGHTPLIHVAATGNELAVGRLLAVGADHAATDPAGRTALTHAAVQGHLRVAEVLLEAGAEVDVRDRNGATPLVYACAKGFYNVPNLLLEHGADPNVRTRSGDTALALAERGNAQRVVRLLLRHGAR